MSLNSQYLVIFKNPRDLQQVSHLGRQMYPHNSAYFMDKFRKATSVPYGCLVVDLKQDTPDTERLISGNVFSTLPMIAPMMASATEASTMMDPTTTATPLTTSTATTASMRPAMMGATTEDTATPNMAPCTTAHAQPLPQIGPEASAEDQLAGGREQIGPPGILANPASEPYIPTHIPSRLPDQSGRGPDEMNKAVACGSCGIQFQNPYFLERHRIKGCGMQEEDEADEDEDEQNAWDDMIDQAYRKHDKLYAEKAKALEEEGVRG